MRTLVVLILICWSVCAEVYLIKGRDGHPTITELTTNYKVVRWFDRFNVVAVESKNDLRSFQDNGLMVEKNQEYRASYVPWNLDRIDQFDLPLDGKFQPLTRGDGMHVFVLDTGIEKDHVGFKGVVFGEGKSFVYNEEPYVDYQGHGTHVAGTIASREYGVATGVTLHAVKVLNKHGKGSTLNVIDGLNWVMFKHKGYSVVNMSLGGGKSEILNSVVKELYGRGIVTVAAAGNEAEDACKGSPSSAPEAITVAASSQADNPAWFSNFGKCVDIFAPGVRIKSLINDGETAAWNGTSMAAPHVAAAVAMYMSVYPFDIPSQIIEGILSGGSFGVMKNLRDGDPNLLLNISTF